MSVCASVCVCVCVCVCVESRKDRETKTGGERVVMEAKKSHDWSPANWSPRKAGDIIQPEFKASESGEPMVYIYPSLRSGGDDLRCLGSISETEKGGKFLLPLFFCSV